MMSLQKLWIVAFCVALTSGMAFGQGAQFSFIWADGDGGSTNWFPMTYDSTDALSPILEDETVVRIYKDVNFDGGYTPLVDQPLVVGSNGAAGEIFPSNEFVFNSADIGRSQGSFLSPSFQYVGATPAFAPIFLLVGCDDGQGGFTVMYSSRSYLIAPGYSEKIINCPTSGDFIPGPCWLFWDTCPPPPTCDPPASPVTGFQASEDDCDQVNMTWTLYDSTGAGELCVDSLVLRRESTVIAVLALTQTSYSHVPPNENVNTYSITVRRCCGTEAEPDEDSGQMPRAPGVSTVTDASSGLCDSVVVTFDNPPSIAGLDSIVLKRDGVEVARDGAGFGGQTGRTIVHHGAPGDSATYTVCGWNAECGYGPLSNGMIGEANPLPGQVQNVVASDGDCNHPSWVTITWDDLSDETGYRVYRSDQGDEVLLSSVSADVTEYMDSIGDVGVVYEYTVEGFNACGTGLRSDFNNGSLPVLITPPTNVSASDDLCDMITINWDDNSSSESGYAVMRTSPPPADTFIVAPNTTTYDDNTVAIFQTYTYHVRGLNACGFGNASNSDDGTAITAPETPLNLSATDSVCAHPSYVLVEWDPAVNATNATEYHVYRDDTDEQTVTHPDTSWQDTGATPGATHTYKVSAFGCDQESALSDPDNGSLGADPPGQVVMVWDSVGCDSVFFCWNTDAVADSYGVFESGGLIGTVFAPDTCFAYETSDSLDYYYQVVAYNVCGSGNSSAVDTLASIGLPSASTTYGGSDDECDGVDLIFRDAVAQDEFYILRDGTPIDTVAGTDSTYSDTTAVPGVEYSYRFVAVNVCGTDTTGSVAGMRMITPPQVTDVAATEDVCGAVAVTWSDPDSNETGFKVLRDDAAAILTVDTLATINDPDSTSFNDTTATPGQTYSYSVIAFNECGEGPESDPDDGIPLAGPGAPPDVTATQDHCDRITISWGTASGDVDSYGVFAGGFLWVTVGDTSNHSVGINLGGAGETEIFVVAYSNECADSAISDTVTGIQLPQPEAAADLAASQDLCAGVELTWTAVSGTVSGYIIQRESVTIDTILADTSAQYSYLDTNAVDGTNNYSVITYSDNEGCDDSDPADIQGNRLPAPTVPTNTAATVDSCNAVYITWSASTGTFDEYIVYCDSVEIARVTAPDTFYVHNSAVPGDTTSYQVSANDDVCGESDYSTAADGYRLEGPTPPINVAATDSGCVTITVTWEASTGAFTEYRVYRDSVLVGVVADTSVRTFDDTFSTAGIYSYIVTAWSASCGETIDSDADAGELLPTMGQVTGLTASADDCEAVLLAWDEMPGAVSYKLWRDNVLLVEGVPTNAYNDSISFPGMTGQYQVAALNTCNEGARSDSVEGMRKSVPSAILNLTASNTICAEVCLTWDNAAGETGYNIYRDGDPVGSTEADITEFCDEGGAPGTEYTYVVRALNECGEGAPSEGVAGTGVATLPQVQGIQTAASCDSVCINWDDLEGETGYRLDYSEDGGDTMFLANVDADVTTFCDTEIEPGVCRDYFVSGVNVCGSGALANPFEGCRLTVPDQAVLVSVSSDVCDTVSVVWNDLDTEDSYSVYRDGSILESGIAADETVYHDLTGDPGVSYDYAVSGVNECGEGLASTIITGRSELAPARVLNVTASSDQCSTVVITWDDLSNETGYSISHGSDPYFFLGFVDADVTEFEAEGFVGADNFTVYATNQCGSGVRSEWAPGEGLDVPAQVQNLTLEEDCGEVTITWTAEATADVYYVLRHAEGGGDFDTVATVTEETTTDSPGTGSWEYAVIAENECGAGAMSGIGLIVIIPALEQVTGLTATNGECDCITLTWDDIENESAYEIYCDDGLLETVGTDVTTYVHCDEPSTCSFEVRGVNDCGFGPLSDAVVGSYIVVPGAPQNVSATDDGCEDITIAWDAVPGAVSYSVFEDASFLISVTEDSHTYDPGPGTYSYTVMAVNVCGDGPISDPDDGARLDVPPQIEGVDATDNSCVEIVISWTDGECDSYTIIRDDVEIATEVEASPYSDDPGAPGIYGYRVVCVNECGPGEPSVEVEGELLEAPGQATEVIASDDLCGEIIITWIDADGDVDYYEIRCNGDSVGTVEFGLETQFVHDELDADTCDYTVVAISDECGEGELSVPDEGISHAVPDAPMNVGTPLTAVCDSILIGWDGADDEVDNYAIFRDDIPEAIATLGNVVEFWDAGIDDAEDHEYTVQASNVICGAGPLSDPVTASAAPLVTFGDDLPATVACGDTVTVTVSQCEGVDSNVVYLIIPNMDPIFVGNFDGDISEYTFNMPDLGDGPTQISDLYLQVESYRGDRHDTIDSPMFDYSGCLDSEEIDALIPEEFYLSQNYPNPFNPGTTFEFGVPKGALVTIEIFDVLGRKVATPVEEFMEPGVHTLVWSCEGCATGMYIVRMVADTKVFHRKMLMMK